MIVAAGIFLVRNDNRFLVGHPTHHRATFWSIPKGRTEDGENPVDAAIRELFEETNVNIPKYSKIHTLSPVNYSSGKKILHPFVLFEGENEFICDDFELKCNSFFTIEDNQVPEMDAFRWITTEEAQGLLHQTQVACLDMVNELINK